MSKEHETVPAQRKVAKEIFGFRVRRVVGDGAWSRVYEVEDTKTHTAYALKHVVSEHEKQDRYVDQLRAEWRIGKHLHHPAIRRIFALKGEGLLNTMLRSRSRDVGLVMELVDAPPLSDLVRVQQRPSMPECLKIFHDVSSGLLHMHLKKFVHADMKPLNILYDPTRRVTKIIDLGQSVDVGTQKVRLQGSAGYIAPEQAREVSDRLFEAVTPATDVFNFGATMYAILMRGKLPPQSQHSSNKTLLLPAEELGTAGDLHASDSTIPHALSVLVSECLMREPSRRTTMAQVVRVLSTLAPATAATV